MHGQKGFSYVEILIAMVVLSLMGLAILAGVFTAHKSTILANEKTTAESLARVQIEAIQNQPYDFSNATPTYLLPAVPVSYTGFSCLTTVTRLDSLNDGFNNDDGLQKITVTVRRDGRTICTLEDYKARK